LYVFFTFFPLFSFCSSTNEQVKKKVVTTRLMLYGQLCDKYARACVGEDLELDETHSFGNDSQSTGCVSTSASLNCAASTVCHLVTAVPRWTGGSVVFGRVSPIYASWRLQRLVRTYFVKL
jgi:hypothetical protein